MARSKRKKSGNRRRRRVGAAGSKGIVMKLAGLGAGAIAGALVSKMVSTAVGSSGIGKYAGPAAPIVGAIMLPKFAKGEFIQFAAYGMGAIGVYGIAAPLVKLPAISGIGMPTYRGTRKLQTTVGAPGYANKVVSGSQDMMVVGALYDN